MILHKEIMLPIQVVTSNLQSFAEPLEVDDFAFPQEAERGEDFGVIGQVNEVFISAPCFLFCCTFVSVTCYVDLEIKGTSSERMQVSFLLSVKEAKVNSDRVFE